MQVLVCCKQKLKEITNRIEITTQQKVQGQQVASYRNFITTSGVMKPNTSDLHGYLVSRNWIRMEQFQLGTMAMFYIFLYGLYIYIFFMYLYMLSVVCYFYNGMYVMYPLNSISILMC